MSVAKTELQIFSNRGHFFNKARANPGEGFWGRNPSLLEVKATLLMADIVRELSRDNIHSGSTD